MNSTDMHDIVKSSYTWPAVILLCAGCFLLCGCARETHFEMPPRPVRVGRVLQMDVPVFMDSFGILSSPHVVDIKPRVTGEIEAILFSEGQHVSRGDLLARIDSRQYQADLEKAEASLQQALVDLKIKQDTLERNRKLVADELISIHEFDKYESGAAAASAVVAFKKAEVERARLDLEFCSIRAPIEGVLGKKQVDAGNVVSANTGPALVNIRMLDPLYVDFTIPERELGRVRAAMAGNELEVKVLLDDDEGAMYSGTLKFMENTVDDSTGTVFLRAIVSNDEKRLWPGQFVRVRLILGVRKDALVVPGASVQMGRDGHYLFVVLDDGKADFRVVSIVQRDREYVVLEKGVEAGETVVTFGQMGLAPGSKVRIIPDADEHAVRPSDSS